MSAEKPPVKGLCLDKTAWFNRAVGEHACSAIQQDPEQPERTLRCPFRGIVLDAVNKEATEDANQTTGAQPGSKDYVEIHTMELKRDEELAGQPGFAGNCLTVDDHLPRLDINPYT